MTFTKGRNHSEKSLLKARNFINKLPQQEEIIRKLKNH